MRHGKKFNHLSRKAPHRKAMLMNMAKSLIEHKRITTTVAKAKALKMFVEPIITKAKNNTTHSRRVVFSYFQDKEPVKELFNEIANKVADRPGGYTRIIRIEGTRLGDNADRCLIELVDYNDIFRVKSEATAKKKTRRRGVKSKKDATSTTTTTAATTDQAPAAEKAAPATTEKKAESATAEKAPAPKVNKEAEAKPKKEEASASEASPKAEKPAAAPKAEKEAKEDNKENK